MLWKGGAHKYICIVSHHVEIPSPFLRLDEDYSFKVNLAATLVGSRLSSISNDALGNPVQIAKILIPQLLLCLSSIAQQNNLSVSAGVAFRSGYHSLHAYGNHLDGYAKTGVAAEVNYRIPLTSPNLSFILSLKGRLNPAVPEMIPLTGVKGYSAKTRKASLTTVAMLAGIGNRLFIGGRWDLEQQLLLGIAGQRLGNTYAEGIQPFPGGKDIYVAQSKAAGDIGFSAIAKIGPVFHLKNRIDIFLMADVWLLLSEMKTTGTYSTQKELFVWNGPSILQQPIVDKFTANHLYKNSWVIETLGGIRFKL